MLAAIAADRILCREMTGSGIVPLPDWITRDQLVGELAARGIRIAFRSGGEEWRTVGDTAGLGRAHARLASL